MNVDQLAQVIKSLNDADLQTLVSHLSGDFTDKQVSTMETMIYVFNTSRFHIANRDASLRDQASQNW